ncbi:mannose/cellobiose epimerase-like protein (N-acyl-D-glucosamine 2-epimerase family) [Motilibacter rhizosphaerae]|uniref:Mannose/cellobiose epimerase-like protein (N-acyl-D-glucosamine 2-epimerase family) n=1 Tax=Motilibacter rhizosphaerae TaxID=598652 RepID=A0A4Q7NT59_9ACTN|nr:AGE family epimerase/isomerase [Motilibacter rhizosphaerae]RZS90321.1 mannose/cellobiose epimerase-like protein (N-acyl-D-glucosamine 2-epimerase family) [Motilibacter rhizosphaerae]
MTPLLRTPDASSGPATPEHRAELTAEAARLVDFARSSVHPDGGFGWLDDQGRLVREHPVELWLTCRMTHVAALALLAGDESTAALVDEGVRALRCRLHDDVHGGWYAAVGPDGPVKDAKESYGHSFVLLAASSALRAGRDGARELLDDALAVHDARFWREDDGLVVDVWDRGWTELEDYRGVNANMHTVEALLAVADVTGDERYRQRALRITTRVLGWAAGNDWRIPEHFDSSWTPLPDYNRADPGHQFRPYGATVGHALEWSRLALDLAAALGEQAPRELRDGAEQLFRGAVADGWAADGADGFVYTTDWDGSPVVRQRLHWVVAEGLAAASSLFAATGEPSYAEHYATWWAYAREHLLDLEGGSWRHELDPENRPAATVWSGKPDVYHAYQAVLVPRLPLAPSFATAIADGLLD